MDFFHRVNNKVILDAVHYRINRYSRHLLSKSVPGLEHRKNDKYENKKLLHVKTVFFSKLNLNKMFYIHETNHKNYPPQSPMHAIYASLITCQSKPTFVAYNNGASNLHTESSPRFHIFRFFHSLSVISVQSALSSSNCSSNCPHSIGSETTAAIS